MTPAENSKRVSDTLAADDGAAPEMQASHDGWFDQDAQAIYGSPDDWTPIKRSGHFRRMAMLDAIDLGDIADKVAADFGVGPWGFACVFPKLRAARTCYGFDVSAKALQISAEADAAIADKTWYFTSDGESIPLDDDTLDVFWGGEVIEHVREPRRFVQEIARVCRHGAQVIMSTPNRDAVYYLAHGEDHTVGPEHIALMGYDELKHVLSLFFSDVRISGYETSLYPDLDQTIHLAEALDLIQQRAEVAPRAASGFLIQARVDKARYEANRREWRLQEYIWNNPAYANVASAQAVALFPKVEGASLNAAPLEIEIEADRIILLFWAHDWSGFAEISLDGATRQVDLFSPYGGFRRVEFGDLAPGPHQLKIRRSGRKRPGAHDDQVIFYKAMAYSGQNADRAKI
jgi:SAM-dependent methyltransferase